MNVYVYMFVYCTRHPPSVAVYVRHLLRLGIEGAFEDRGVELEGKSFIPIGAGIQCVNCQQHHAGDKSRCHKKNTHHHAQTSRSRGLSRIPEAVFLDGGHQRSGCLVWPLELDKGVACAYTHTHTHTHACMNTCMYVCIYVCMYLCVCVCVNVCTFVCTYTYPQSLHIQLNGHVQPSIHPHIQYIHACIHINTEEIHLWKIPPRAQYDLCESAAGSVCERVREGL